MAMSNHNGKGKPLHLLVDSTGLRLYGAGKWLLEKHRTKACWSWRKLHIGLDAGTGQIVAASLTVKVADEALSTTSLVCFGARITRPAYADRPRRHEHPRHPDTLHLAGLQTEAGDLRYYSEHVGGAEGIEIDLARSLAAAILKVGGQGPGGLSRPGCRTPRQLPPWPEAAASELADQASSLSSSGST